MTELVTDTGSRMRAWRLDDAPAVQAALSDPSMRTQVAEAVDSIAKAEAWIADHNQRWDEGTAFSWAVVDDEGLLGSATVASINHRHGTGWISYWTTAAARGRGVASSALRRLAVWSFEDLGLFRLELGHRVNNPASCRVAHAAGFAIEGLERQKLLYDNERFDVELHARLATDPAP